MSMPGEEEKVASRSYRAAVAAASLLLVMSCALLLIKVSPGPGTSLELRLTSHTRVHGSSKKLLQEKLPEFQQQHQVVPGPDGLVSWLTYISDPAAALRLGCPVNHTMACFYRFQLPADKLPADELPAPLNGTLISEADCVALFQPLPVDHGRQWCIREGREPMWLREVIPEKSWRHLSDPVLLTGKLDSPNPTHQANLHFLAIWKWMRRLGLQPGELHMMVDHDERWWAPGKFGAGMATALGDLAWLPLLEPGLLQFERLQFSIPGGEFFPFDLKRHVIDGFVDADYLEMAENIKARSGPALAPGEGPSDLSWREKLTENTGAEHAASPVAERTPRVLVARRKNSETRVWANAEDFAQELRAIYNMNAEVVTFGDLEFPDQVKLAASADVLVGITGSDLVNLMFLPLAGSVVEVFPTLHQEEVFVPELGNMAKLLGKSHFSYVTTGNVTLDNSQSRLLYRTKLVTIAIPDLAALVGHAAHQAISGSSLQHTSCKAEGGIVRCTTDSTS